MNDMSAKSPEQQVYVYDANQRWNWRTRLQEIWRFQYLLQNLVIRNVKARYKNSILGVLWSLLNPLGLMLVFTVVFSVLSSDATPRQYPIFLLVGIIPWRFFAGTTMSSSTAILQNAALVKKVFFPRELLPVSTLLSELVNFLFGLIVLVAFLYAFGIGLTIHALWLPVILFVQMIFMLGLGLILCSLTTFYRDVVMVLEVALQAGFFLTPVFYSFDSFFGPSSTILGITFNPTQVMRWINPMASIIDGYRTVLWGTIGSNGPASMNPIFMARTFIESLIILAIGYYIFVRTEHLFGEKM